MPAGDSGNAYGLSRRHYRPSVKDVLKHKPALERVLKRYEGNSLKSEAARNT